MNLPAALRPACLPMMLALAALAGCASPAPTQFYTLLPPASATAPPAQDPAFQIEVLPVSVPAQVDVPQIVVREGSGRLVPVETRRWIAPLEAELHDALASALTQRLGVREVGRVTADERLPLYRVQLGLKRFDSVLGDAATIEASWSLRSARDGRRVASCDSRIREPVGAGYEALAAGHQRAVQKLADEIAHALLALQAGKAVEACS